MTRRDQVKWTTPDIEKEKATLSFQVSEIMATETPDAVSEFLQSRIAFLESAESQEDQLKRFVAIIFMLDWHNRYKVLSSPQIGQLSETARSILKAYGIHPESSNLSWLYGEVELALAQSRRREGRFFEATWLSGMALHHARKSGLGDAGFPFLIVGLRAMRLGNFDLAYEALVKTEEATTSTEHKLQARVNRVQILRLRKKWDDARFLINKTVSGFDLPLQVQLELEWENFCINALENGDFTGMINSVGRTGSHRHPSYMLESTLWMKIIQSKTMMGRVPKAESIKRAFPNAINRNSTLYQMYESAHQLDVCYDNDVPIQLRLNDLGRHLAQAGRMITLDKELLLWAAASRWLGRYHQPMMAVFCAEEYKALSLRISGGESADALNLSLDYNPWSKKDLSRIDKEAVAIPIPLDSISVSKMERAATLSRLTIGIASVKIKSKFKQAFSPAASVEQIIEEEFREIGELLIQAIGAMKGPTVKLAQLISFSTPDLPEPMREALRKSQDSTHPVNTDLIVKVIETSLGRPTEDLFLSFDRTPLAAASIGQIHKAVLTDGSEVVVKTQYPGIIDVIKADIKMIRMVKFIFHRIFPMGNVEDVIVANEKALYEECDYVREADYQMRIKELHKDNPDVIVPHVYQDICRKDVLVMDYVEGKRFAEFKEHASSEEKQRAGLIIYKFAMDSFYNHGIYNADPHPGNYLFTDDGRVCFLDFGFAETFPTERREIWRQTILAVIHGDKKKFIGQIKTLGLVVDPVRFDFDMVAKMIDHGFAFLREGTVHRFDENFVKRAIYLTTMGTANRRFVTLPIEDIRLMRFLWCLHAVLGELNIEANWRDILLEIVERTPINTKEATG